MTKRFKPPPSPARGRAARLSDDDARCLCAGPAFGSMRFGGYARPAHLELDDDACRDPEALLPRGVAFSEESDE